MVFNKKVFHAIQRFLRERKSLLASAALTLPSALLISVFYYSLSGRPYSIPHLLRSAIILSIGLFGVIWWIVNRRKSFLRNISNRLVSTYRRTLSTRGGLFAFIVLILTTGLVSTFEFPHINMLSKPNYKYLLKISPSKGNAGNICILEIKNSYGNVFGYNETVFKAQNSGGWKRDINGCDHFLEAGESGSISFENIGPIDDVLEIMVRLSPKAGSFNLESEPGSNKVINLRSALNGEATVYF